MSRYIDCSHVHTYEEAIALLDSLYAALSARPHDAQQYARIQAAERYLIARGLYWKETEDIYA